MFLPFFLLGYQVKKIGIRLVGTIREKILYLLYFGLIYYMCSIYLFDKKLVLGGMLFQQSEVGVSNWVLLRVLLIIFSVIGCFGLVKLMPANKVFLSKYGNRTFQIYIFHDIVIRFFLFFHVYQRFEGIQLTTIILVATVLTFHLSSMPILGELIVKISDVAKRYTNLIGKARAIPK